MKRLPLCLLLFTCLLVGCDTNESTDHPQLEFDYAHFHAQTVYIETFDVSMLRFYHIDAKGNRHHITAEQSMLISGEPHMPGMYPLHIHYQGLDLHAELNIESEPLLMCHANFVAYDMIRHEVITHLGTHTFKQPKSQGCVLDDMPHLNELEGYQHSHLSHEVGEELMPGEDIYLYMIPLVYTVTFYGLYDDILKETEVFHGGQAVAPDVSMLPEYFSFVQWNRTFNQVKDDLDIYPQGIIITRAVHFYDEHGEYYAYRSVKLGQAVELPEPPSKAGYVFTGWDQALSHVYETVHVYPVFERSTTLTDWLNELVETNFTVHVDMENLPPGVGNPDGTITNTIAIDGQYMRFYLWQQSFFITIEEDSVYVIDQYEFDDYQAWHKDPYMDDFWSYLHEWMIVDIFALDDEMFTPMVGYDVLKPTYYDAMISVDIENLNDVHVVSNDDVMVFSLMYDSGETIMVRITEVGTTTVTLPKIAE